MLVAGRADWIGGMLQELESGFPETGFAETEIVDIVLEPMGDSAWFEVRGNDFVCGFDVRYGGVVPGERGWFTFAGYGGHRWRISKPIRKETE